MARRAPARPVGLRAWRERAGLSRMDLALKLLPVRMDPQSLYNLETGKSRTTTIDKAQALAEALSEATGEQVTIDDLFPRPPKKRRGGGLQGFVILLMSTKENTQVEEARPAA